MGKNKLKFCSFLEGKDRLSLTISVLITYKVNRYVLGENYQMGKSILTALKSMCHRGRDVDGGTKTIE